MESFYWSGKHTETFNKKCWMFIRQLTGPFLALVPLNLKYPPKNDFTDYKMAFTLLYSERHNKYLALTHWSTISYWNILKSKVHNCSSQLSFRSPYNQLSEQSVLQLSLYHTKCLINGKLGGWVCQFRG